jgi:hypothetical protein
MRSYAFEYKQPEHRLILLAALHNYTDCEGIQKVSANTCSMQFSKVALVFDGVMS